MKPVRSMTAGAAVMLLMACASAGGQYAAARPAGVDEAHWIPLSESAGIVIVGVESGARGQRVPLDGDVIVPGTSVTGILMARQDDAWVRVKLQPEEMRIIPSH